MYCHFGGVEGIGLIPNKIMFVFSGPSLHEINTHTAFTSRKAQMLRAIMQSTGISFDTCYATYLTCNNGFTCLNRFYDEVEQVNPQLIVYFGEEGLASLGFSDKFSDLRGGFHKWYGRYILITNDPGAMFGDNEGEGRYIIASNIVIDLQKIKMFFDDDAQKKNFGFTYTTLETRQEVQDMLNNLPLRTPVVLDVETTSVDSDALNIQTDILLSFSIAYRADDTAQVFVIPQELTNNNYQFPQGIEWAFHYGVFDTQIIYKTYGIWLKIHHDSHLMHYHLDERAGNHKLKPLGRAYAYAPFYDKDLDRKNLATVLPNRVYEYNATDTYVTLCLIERFMKMLKEDFPSESPYNDYSLPLVNIFNKIHFRGMKVDLVHLQYLANTWGPLLEEKIKALQEVVVSTGGPPIMNFNSPKQVGGYLYEILNLPVLARSKKTNAPSTSEETIKQLAITYPSPFFEKFLDYKELFKLISTYVVGLFDDIKRGRIHPQPNLTGTVGGRFSYTKPPIQTIPRPQDASKSNYGPQLRKLIIAGEGRILIEIDLKQAEVWGAYYYCQSKAMLEDLQSGDFHRRAAATINNCLPSEVTSVQRSDAKSTTFGMLYRIGVVKLAAQIKKTPQEAGALIAGWSRRYPEYEKYYNNLWNDVRTKGEITTLTGRKRRYPIALDTSIGNQICNTPIQSTSHDVLLSAIIESYEYLASKDAHIILDCHDAILIDAPAPLWKPVLNYIVPIIEKPRFGMLVGIPCDTKIGPSWGETKEIVRSEWESSL